MEFTEGMSKVAQAFELVGVGILIVGAVLVAWTTVVALIRKQPAYEQSRIRLGRTLLLSLEAVSYTHLRAHETVLDLVCRLLLEKKKLMIL